MKRLYRLPYAGFAAKHFREQWGHGTALATFGERLAIAARGRGLEVLGLD